MDPQGNDIRNLVDSNHYGQFRLPVCGSEAVLVRSTNPTSQPLLVEISLSQVTIYGPLPAIRERLGTMVELLDRVVAEPRRWADIKMTQVAPGRWKRLRPHPFSNRPAASAESTQGADSTTGSTAATRGRIIPLRHRSRRKDYRCPMHG